MSEACDTTSDSLAEALGGRNYPELTILFFVLVTTVHAQDFRDVEGDRAIGRNTIPMILPEVSRLSMPIFLPAWSILIARSVDCSVCVAVGYVGLSIVAGFRFLFMRRIEDDRTSYNLYNVSFPILY